MLNVPVLFLIFNRLDTTKLVFEKIRLAEPNRLYVASDGPRIDNDKEHDIVLEIRNWVIENVSWKCTVKTLFRERNMGCGKAVSAAIDWFFDNEEMGIVLEDDCLPNMSFFQFCELNLKKYKDDTRISAISGDNFSDKLLTKDSYFFSRFIFIWGWATWRRTWLFHKEIQENFETIINQPLTTLSINHKNADNFIIKNAYKAYSGEIDTWDYQWILSNYLYHGLIIIPKVNLVKNIGFESTATHTNVKTNNMAIEVADLDFPLIHPLLMIPNSEYDNFLYNNVFNWGFLKHNLLIIRSLIKKIIPFRLPRFR